MGATVSSMFGHGATHSTHPAVTSGTPLLALTLLAAAALVAVLLRRRFGTDDDGGWDGRARRAVADAWRGAARAFQAARTALAAAGLVPAAGRGPSPGRGPGPGRGPVLRVLSRLALGPGRYLCTVQAGDRVILVAVGDEVRLLGEVEAQLPLRRRRRRDVASRRFARRVVRRDDEEEGVAAATVVALATRADAGPSAPAGVCRDSVEAPPAPPRASAPTAALLERYRATASATAPPAGPAPDAGEDEATAYFSQLLEASIERMEAAEARILRRADPPGSPRRAARAETAGAAGSAQDAGL